MSHTVIPDHRDRMLQLENVSNRLVHHCRIVNVTWKAAKVPNFPKTQWPPAIFGPPIINGESMIFWPKGPLDNILVGSPSTENARFVTSRSCAPIDARTLGNC